MNQAGNQRMFSVLISIFLAFLLMVTVCLESSLAAPQNVYQVDFNADDLPSRSLPQTYLNIRKYLQEIYFIDTSTFDDLRVTDRGFSFINRGRRHVFRYDKIQHLAVFCDPGSSYFYVKWDENEGLFWKYQNDAQDFVDAVMAMKYYISQNLIVEDPASFAFYKEKVRDWLMEPYKSPLPDEVKHYQALAEEALREKDPYQAADFYEKGLAIDPLWPSGEYNAGLIYGELEIYPMAIHHIRRYLMLKPDAKDAGFFENKIYVWEVKISE